MVNRWDRRAAPGAPWGRRIDAVDPGRRPHPRPGSMPEDAGPAGAFSRRGSSPSPVHSFSSWRRPPARTGQRLRRESSLRPPDGKRRHPEPFRTRPSPPTPRPPPGNRKSFAGASPLISRSEPATAHGPACRRALIDSIPVKVCLFFRLSVPKSHNETAYHVLRCHELIYFQILKSKNRGTSSSVVFSTTGSPSGSSQTTTVQMV